MELNFAMVETTDVVVGTKENFHLVYIVFSLIILQPAETGVFCPGDIQTD
jgi:hypothetical protein